MLFHSWEFLFVFLPIVIFGFYIIGKWSPRLSTAWLFLSSLVFYGWWNPKYVVLILGSILFNYLVGIKLGKKTSHRKTILVCGIAVNILLLGFFKYAMFFAENINGFFGEDISIGIIVLPLAISFFTFQQVAYLVDSYQEKVRENDFLNYCLFVTFFPQLIAGPIVHHREMMPQFARSLVKTVTAERFAVGATILFIGLFKKVVLADTLEVYANPVFQMAENGEDMHFLTAWIGALSYTFQIYFDFSGYTDMAVGVARMFGVRLPVNFYSPYQAVSIVDFWRRWHMTLSRFLRDYLYIPLGGNRQGKTRRYGNLMLTMLLGGLWHGAAWNFVIWGGLHGLYLSVYHFWQKFSLVKFSDSSARGITFIFVVVAWVFFRAETLQGAGQMFCAMVSINLQSLADLPDLLLGDASPWVMLFGFYKGNFVWVFLLLCYVIVSTLPNTSDFMRLYRPYIGRGHKSIVRRGKTLLWRPNLLWAFWFMGVTAWGVFYVVYKPSNVFLYFQF